MHSLKLKTLLINLSLILCFNCLVNAQSIDYEELSKKEYAVFEDRDYFDMEILKIIVDEYDKHTLVKDYMKNIKALEKAKSMSTFQGKKLYSDCLGYLETAHTYSKWAKETDKGIKEDKRSMNSASSPEMREIYRQRYNNGIDRLDEYIETHDENISKANRCIDNQKSKIKTLVTKINRLRNDLSSFYLKYESFGRNEKARKKADVDRDKFSLIEAKQYNSINSYTKYLEDSSNKLYRKEAKEKLEFLTPLKTFSEVAKYINKNPREGYYKAYIRPSNSSFYLSKRVNSKKYYRFKRIYSSQISNIKLAKYSDEVVIIYGVDDFKTEINYYKKSKSKKSKTKLDESQENKIYINVKDSEIAKKIVTDINNIIKNR